MEKSNLHKQFEEETNTLLIIGEVTIENSTNIPVSTVNDYIKWLQARVTYSEGTVQGIKNVLAFDGHVSLKQIEEFENRKG